MSSWWDTSGFSNLASQALKTAQKRIDKVLDIDEGSHSSKNKKKSSKDAQKSAGDDTKSKPAAEGDFWSAWMSPTSSDSSKEGESKAPVNSSWSLPWGVSSESESDSKEHEAQKKSDGSKKANLLSPSTEIPSAKTSNVSSHLGVDAEGPLPQAMPQAMPQKPSFDSDSSEIQQCSLALETLENMSAKEDTCQIKNSSVEENISKINYSSIVEEPENCHLNDEHDGEKEKDSEVQDFTVCSNVEISNASSMDGWDISDSVLKLVEMHEQTNTNETDYGQSIDETVSLKGFNRVIFDNIESVETNEEANVSIETPLIYNATGSGVTDNYSIKEETCDDNFEIRTQKVFADSNDDANTSNIISGESLEEQTVVDKSSEFSDNQLQQNLEECEQDTMCEVISTNNDSTCIIDQGTIQESFTVPEILPDLSNSERFEIDKTNEDIVTAEDIKNPNDFMHATNTGSGKTDIDTVISRSSSDLDVDAHAGNASSTGSSETSRLDSSADTIVDKSYVEIESLEHKDIPYSLFGADKAIEDNSVVQADLSKSISPASSYVKCMLEEAMEESGREDSGSDNHSNESKSESSKVDSELEKSVYSGHESSDDIETTTSSDIEIISASLLSSSDKQFSAHYDLPPLKISLQSRHTSGDGKGHRRSDSQSSSSTQSKGGDHERLSPDRGDGHGWVDEEFQHQDLEAVQEEGNDNPYHPERLLKLTKIVVEQQISGGQKLAEMAEVLQARENKLVQMSKDNHQLMEDNSILRSQLQQSEEAREVETTDLKALTDEFTVRMGESEKKLQSALREKESLKGQVSSLQSELEKRSQGSDLEALLDEKTEQVNELMAEGEKLSKQQLQSSTIIKKLRAKEKETDATLTSQKKKMEEQTKELERLKVVLDSKEQMESKQAEAIAQLNSAVQRQERDYNKILSDQEDAQEKNRGLQAALDNAYKEIAELHRSNASQDSKAQETALSVETSIREELRISMEREQMRFRQEREAFIMQADDLRLDMARLEKEHERREDLLREEITHLQERLQQDEARSQDLSQSVTSATRPLLRQIENLQATFGAQSKAWEKVEKSLTDRLAETQTSMAMAQEKERTASDNHMEISAKLASLEMTNTRLKQEKAILIAEKESYQSQMEDLQDAKDSLVAHFEMTKKTLNHDIGQLKIEKVQLESQLNLEKIKLESERKKCAALEEQVSLAERERPKSRGTPSPSPSMSVSRQESLVGSIHEYNNFGMRWPYDEAGDSGSVLMGTPKASVYESLRQSGAAVIVENLESQLKLREGEIAQLQSEIAQLERTRESMARELVNLTTQNEELQETKVAFHNLEQQYQELNNRYSAILLMYGEKEEQVQELRLDLQDVKEMYKTQIDALMAK